jgi:hypothetical protein
MPLSKERYRLWREKNKERIRHKQRIWEQTHREQRREAQRRYYYKNIERSRQMSRERARKQNKKLVMDVLQHYGGTPPKCAVCGLDDPDCLLIDHVNGNGTQDRKKHGGGYGLYRWLRKNNYPNGYQVLCGSCNLKKLRKRIV